MKFLSTSFIVMLILILNACKQEEKSALPSLDVPNTFGIQTKADNVTLKNLDQIEEVGFRVIRRAFYWYQVEKEKGVYDFSWYDSLYKNASSRNLRFYGLLYGENKLYENDGLGGIQTEAGRKGFADFAAAVAEHFRGKGVIYEIWNEPNIGSFWKKGAHNTDEFAHEYTSLVKEIVPAMHAADPESFVVAGAVSALWQPSFNWMDECFESGILESGINGWSVHPYSFITPEEHAEGYERVRNLMAKHGAPEDFPLLNSERGYTVDTTRREGWTGGDPEKADEYMARHLVRQYFVDLMSDIRLTIYYEWKGEDFGIIWEGVKRPAYYASMTLVDQLKGYKLNQRLATDSDLDYVLEFENKNGKKKLVVWTAPPPGKDPEQTNKHTIQIRVQAKGKVNVCNIYGEESDLQVSDGKVEILLEGAPKYLSL